MPGGARGVLLKLKMPLNCALAESLGLRREPRMRFNVTMACGRTRSHRWRGKSLWMLHEPPIKWFLKVRIACADVRGVELAGSRQLRLRETL
jgi:hypothetical protein